VHGEIDSGDPTPATGCKYPKRTLMGWISIGTRWTWLQFFNQRLKKISPGKHELKCH